VTAQEEEGVLLGASAEPPMFGGDPKGSPMTGRPLLLAVRRRSWLLPVAFAVHPVLLHV
jgi:hypothetical protein